MTPSLTGRGRAAASTSTPLTPPAAPGRRRTLALALALIAGAAPFSLLTPAWAHGPTPQRIDEQIEIAAPPDKVWALVGNFADFAAWNPALSASKAEQGNAAGSRRTLTLARGGQVDEELDEYAAAERSLSYRSGRVVDPKVLAVGSYSARLRVMPSGSGSVLEFRARAYRADTKNEPAKGLDDEAAVQALKAYIRPALEKAKATLEQG